MPAIKLDPTILDSSLWLDLPARNVFLTALLMARPITLTEPTVGIEPISFEDSGFTVPPGDYGFVPAVGGAIVSSSHVLPREDGWAALEKLCDPDPQSTSTAHQGRQMQRIQGGYIVLNYLDYRGKDKTKKERQERWMDKLKSNKQPPKPAKKVAPKPLPIGGDFDIFWEAYPHKVSKAAALKVWRKLNPDASLLDVILSAVEAQSKSPQWVKDNGQFIPHPSTWLNQRRWEDAMNGLPKASEEIQSSWRSPAPEPEDLPFTTPLDDL